MNDSLAARVVVALSGGVDSAVAAALLAGEGFDVLGCYLDFGHETEQDTRAAGEASDIAQKLGVKFEIVDAKKTFAEVLKYFASQYASGRTPNPCGMCNRTCKFAALADYADRQNTAFIATGHHVIKLSDDDHGILARSPEIAKDQTYALFNVPADILKRCVFPIGALGDKAAVRRIASDLGLSVADKPDSQDMCFAPDGNYEPVLQSLAPEALVPGDIIDQSGKFLGRHRGIGLYTIGQRRGLGIAAGEPVYVTEIDPVNNTVRLGPRESAASDFLTASQSNWHVDMPPGEYRLTVQVRYAQRAVLAAVTVLDDKHFKVKFDSPVHAITPGQAAVVYDGDVLLGGGWID